MEGLYDLYHPQNCFWSKEIIKECELLMQSLTPDWSSSFPSLDQTQQRPTSTIRVWRRIRQHLYLKWHNNAWKDLFKTMKRPAKIKYSVYFPMQLPLLCCGNLPRLLHSVLDSTAETNAENLEAVQRRPTKMMKGLENKIWWLQTKVIHFRRKFYNYLQV